MSNLEESGATVHPVRALQIVIGAMLMGIVTFATVAVVVRASDQAPQAFVEGKPMISYVAIAVAIGSLLLREIIGTAVVGAAFRKIAAEAQQAGTSVDPAAQLTGLFFKKTIIAAAMTEGPALFAIIAYMVEGNAAPLIVAMLLAASITLLLPTQSRLADWIDVQQRRLDSERMR
jgi:hypothetical protein